MDLGIGGRWVIMAGIEGVVVWQGMEQGEGRSFE